MLISKRYNTTEIDRNTWPNVPSYLPISSDTHQVVAIQKETFRRWINNLKSDCINNICNTSVLGIEPSSVINRQTKHCWRLKWDATKVSKQDEFKRNDVSNSSIYYSIILLNFKEGKFRCPKALRFNRSRPSYLVTCTCAIGNLWSTSIHMRNHEAVGLQKEMSVKMDKQYKSYAHFWYWTFISDPSAYNYSRRLKYDAKHA